MVELRILFDQHSEIKINLQGIILVAISKIVQIDRLLQQEGVKNNANLDRWQPKFKWSTYYYENSTFKKKFATLSLPLTNPLSLLVLMNGVRSQQGLVIQERQSMYRW